MECMNLLYLIQCNAHRIVTAPEPGAFTLSHTPIGLGIYPITSLLNHSCDPNSVHHFEPVLPGESAVRQQAHSHAHVRAGPRLCVRALRDIKEGEELCYSYVDLYQSRRARQQMLWNAYFFQCTCKRCSQSQQVSSNNPEHVEPNTSSALG
jgi:SET and MYND domain-containing protein